MVKAVELLENERKTRPSEASGKPCVGLGGSGRPSLRRWSALRKLCWAPARIGHAAVRAAAGRGSGRPVALRHESTGRAKMSNGGETANGGNVLEGFRLWLPGNGDGRIVDGEAWKAAQHRTEAVTPGNGSLQRALPAMHVGAALRFALTGTA